MRIGYLTYGLDRAPTGIGRYAVELLHALTALPDRPDMVLLTTEQRDDYDLWQTFEQHPLPGCRLLPALLSIGNIVIRDAVRRYGLDAIHDPNGVAPFSGLPARIGRIVTIHDAFAYVYPETHNALDNWRYRWHLPRMARRTDAIITVSDCSRHDLAHHLGLEQQQIQVIAEGIDPQFRPVADSAERRAILARYGIMPPYMLYVGGINARKNIARLFEAYARVREHHPGITLVIGGKRQWQTAAIDATYRRLNLAGHVHFTGYIDDADLPALYSAAELFVFPSLYEGFGLPPLEAMACGTPVVASNAASLAEVLGDAALTIDPYDVDGLVAAIQCGLTDQALRSELRQRGVQQAARFSWQQAANETDALYRRVLHKAAGDGTAWHYQSSGSSHHS